MGVGKSNSTRASILLGHREDEGTKVGGSAAAEGGGGWEDKIGLFSGAGMW